MKLSLTRIYALILLVVFGLIVIHAPLSVFLGSLLPDWALAIKAWKELLLLIAAILATLLLTQNRLWTKLFSDKIIWLALAFVLVHIFGLIQWNGVEAAVAGLMIDLRFVAYFVLVYVLMLLVPHYRRWFIKAFVAAAAVVICFALVQQVLPNNFLAHLGYGPDTISPYTTVDRNYDFVRHNSTLRGPNPLGAYAAVFATVAAAFLLSSKNLTLKKTWPTILLSVLSVIVVYLSYSRSAYLALAVGLGIVLAVLYARRVRLWQWLSLGGIGVAMVGGILMFSGTDFVSNVILHEDPGESNNINSNAEHARSLQTGLEKMLEQPFGAGVGSTGSASLLTDKGLIIENQYLFIAHEAGWLGLATFIALFGYLMWRLWAKRAHPLALGVFASGVGLAVIGLFLPVWVDDTVSIIWWGLAALAVALRPVDTL